MKKLIFWALVASIVLFVILADHPMLMFLNFIVGGIVPGLNVSLGFVPFVGVILLLVLLARTWSKNIKHQMINRAASLNKVENETKDFADRNAGEPTKNTSVIAAPEIKATKA